jgi:serine/threonine protein kinase/tetratricopeptide (TPR) repeat protein
MEGGAAMSPPVAKELFADAIELPEAERAEFLRRACGADAALLGEVKLLIQAHAGGAGFLNMPTLDSRRLVRALVGEAPGSLIGRYRLIQTLGEGGFGVVFVAEQTEPVARRVALKVIKPGMDSARVIARFEAERQALALMDHPNIAKVLDAGTTDSGRPYFVMELVSGRPLTAYCDEHTLTIRERLELFMEVCGAVQHAHLKGVIHRDLNPRNILVSEQEGRALARVIDFGIAKAIERRAAEATAFTEQGQFIGTPEYMSPEQTGGGPDIDTRTDVYSLGVVLYELLTGSTPFESHRLRSAAFDEVRRIIREVDPPRPSTRLLSSQESLAGAAAHRGVQPARLGTMVRGDLDWIVLKAMEKDRARRYDTPGALAADVQRYLSGEPVAAAPPGAAYRVRKFVGRHRMGVIAAGLVAGALVAGMSLALWQAGVASRERDAARHSAEEAVKATAAAKARETEMEQVAEFQAAQTRGINAKALGERLHQDLLEQARAGKAEGSEERAARLEAALAPINLTNVALRTLDHVLFERSVDAAREKFAEQPLVRARLLQTLAFSLRTLGLLDEAVSPQEEALRIRRELLGNEHHDTRASISETGLLMRRRGKLPEAEAYLCEVLELDRRLNGEQNDETLTIKSNLADVLAAQGRFGDAEPLFREVMERRRATSSDSGPMLSSLNNMAFILREQGKFDQAEPFAREAAESCERVLGPDHPTTITALNTLAGTYWSEGKLDLAEPLFRSSLDRARRVFGDNHPTTLALLFNRGSLLRDQGHLMDAEACYREASERFAAVEGPGHPDTLMARQALGISYMDEKRWAEAEPCLRDAARGFARAVGADRGQTISAQKDLAHVLTEQGRFSEAESELLAAESALSQSGQRDGDPYRSVVRSLAGVYEAWEKADPGGGHAAKAVSWRAQSDH